MTEIWNLSTLCRCCHSDGCFKKLDLPYQTENSAEIYEVMMQEALGIRVIQPPIEEASYMICDDCIKRLRDAFKFREQVLSCEEKFKVYCTNEQFQVKSEVETNDVESYVNDVDDEIQTDDYLQKDYWHSVPVKEEKTMNKTAFEDDSSVDEPLASTSRSSSDIHPTILDGSFFEIINELSGKRNVVALCKKCLPNRVEIKGNRQSSSNFKTHLKRKHGHDTVIEYEAYVKSKRSKIVRHSSRSIELSPRNQISMNVPSYSQTDFDRDLVKYFINSMIPLLSVNDPHFQKLIQHLNPAIQIMDRRSLGRSITQVFFEERNLIKQQLSEVTHVCLTVQVWSGHPISFLGVTAHWLDSNTLKRTSRSLACNRFKSNNSNDTVYEMLQEIYSTFCLHSKNVNTCLVRNGTSFLKAFRSFGVRHNISNGIGNGDCAHFQSATELTDSDTDNNETSIVDFLESHLTSHLKCATHVLNLCAIDANKVFENENTDISKIHYESLKKCSRLWKASRFLPTGQTIRNILGQVLTNPENTRWISIYEALKEILSIKDKSQSLHEALNLKTPISESEFLYIEEYLTCTKPIADAIEILASENAKYYGILFPTILTLKNKLVRLIEENTFVYCNYLVKAYLSSLETRFQDFLTISSQEAENAALAAITHPTYKKLKWTSLLEHAQFVKIKNLLVHEISKNILTEELMPLPRSKGDEYFDFDYNSDSELNSNEPKSKAELIVSQYFSEKSRDLSLLNIHSEIKELFIKQNTPLPSLTLLQRMFENNIMKNCNVYDVSEMFERRIVLKMNMCYKEGI